MKQNDLIGILQSVFAEHKPTHVCAAELPGTIEKASRAARARIGKLLGPFPADQMQEYPPECIEHAVFYRWVKHDSLTKYKFKIADDVCRLYFEWYWGKTLTQK